MTDKPEDKTVCPNCLATDVSFNVLNEFTEGCPEVTMSYDNWMYLRFIIETEIKRALGVPVDESDDASEKPTVQ